MVGLTLLGEPAWDGALALGRRSADLLACLYLAGEHGVGVDRLLDELWPDEMPSGGAKALQVVVSRTRKATTAALVERQEHGYRLCPDAADIDAVTLDALVGVAGTALRDGEVATAIDAAQRARALLVADDDGTAPLARLRQRARQQQHLARRILGLALARSGSAERALPVLLAAHADDADDDEVLAALLLAEASVKGPAAALDRYERHRHEVADRLGVDLPDALRRIHLQLLAADQPARHGVRYDADDLVGRGDDLGALLGLIAGHRVVTILGAGGLGKTRMAHLVARHAAQSVVHVVELVGVRDGDDVVGEIGSVLGVRDSVTALGALTAAQRADLRSRIAVLLDRSPALLVIDNCEHVVGAVAELVAFLVASTRDLRVLTTSRSPLAISAERVYPLAQLDADDASRLFRLRAVAVRPGVVLVDADIAALVARLDGLPLAIELAAAKVRVMSVAEITRRLDNRFELLRGGDRSAPDRHQTLLAVIDWSWSLLSERQRRALRRLSVFSDGFTLAGAEALVGPGALDDVVALVDQSLLSVTESDGALRYRMLETVREFGRMHLVDAGDDEDAYAARRAWAMAYVAGSHTVMFSVGQPEEVARLLAEETNLADVLRRALAGDDSDAVVGLVAVLAWSWIIRGEPARGLVLAGPVGAVLVGYAPPPELVDQARLAAAIMAGTAMIGRPDAAAGPRGLLAALGPGEDPNVGAFVRVMSALTDPDEGRANEELARLMHDDDRATRAMALRWVAQVRENVGDVAAAIGFVTQALELWRPEDGIWARTSLHLGAAQLFAATGDVARGAEHAELALPDLLRLTAVDDAMDARSIMGLAALADGDVDRARALVRANSSTDAAGALGGAVGTLSVQAEIALLEGDVTRGLATYREMAVASERPFPGLSAEPGMEPWALYGLAIATAAHALHGEGADLYDALTRRLPEMLRAGHIDYPVLGIVLFATGLSGLRRGVLPPACAASMFALADRFGYMRVIPSTAWQHAENAVADAGAMADLTAARERLGDRFGPQLLDEARAVAEQLPT